MHSTNHTSRLSMYRLACWRAFCIANRTHITMPDVTRGMILARFSL